MNQPQAPALLQIRGLSKFYNDVPAVDRVSLDVAAGEIVMIVGPSGAGKSTALRCINRIEIPSEGEITLAGINMAGEMKDGQLVADPPTQTAKKRQRIGMVF